MALLSATRRVCSGLARRALSSAATGGGLGSKTDLRLRDARVVSSKNLGANIKPRILVVGSGWGGFSFLGYIDKGKYDVHLLSPSNHFLFTPLLPSSVVGTLEFRAIQEPVRTMPGLGAYYQAKAVSIDLESRTVQCRDVFKDQDPFQVEYDFLVLAAGAKTNTFNTPGIQEREGEEVFFLKHLYHARLIRNRILECFERAAIAKSVDPVKRDQLLTIVVVGGGPTNCELVGELNDFITVDVAKWYPDLVSHIQIHLVERGPRLLGSFDPSISDYVLNRFVKRNIKVHTGVAVTRFDPETKVTHLSNGMEIPTGVMVWSAGLAQVKFVQNEPQFTKGPGGRVLIDDHLMVMNPAADKRIFALGDCAVNTTAPMAPLAQAAAQQAKYLAEQFNRAPPGVGLSKPAHLMRDGMSKPFKYYSLGSMVTMGQFQGALDMTQVGDINKPKNLGFMMGMLSFFLWRSAYFLKQNSWTNRVLIPLYWFKSFVLGRDISRF
jgi:NADH dehydrogenase FAD-containing subunit